MISSDFHTFLLQLVFRQFCRNRVFLDSEIVRFFEQLAEFINFCLRTQIIIWAPRDKQCVNSVIDCLMIWEYCLEPFRKIFSLLIFSVDTLMKVLKMNLQTSANSECVSPLQR